mmetsp:Transcript_69831/g.110837  ORF Transcript_69831/g.110837 Transcript_69831/m.110837 type:complete len:1117 (+) Transcript_69831:42-3392(+)
MASRERNEHLLEKALSNKIRVLCDDAYFDENDFGMILDQDGESILAEAAQALKDFPAWTVVLEGHCPGRPEDNDAFRESIGEEAADLCKSYLQKVGLINDILCEGRGCSKGFGMCVQMSMIKPENEQLDGVLSQESPPLATEEAEAKRKANEDEEEDKRKAEALTALKSEEDSLVAEAVAAEEVKKKTEEDRRKEEEEEAKAEEERQKAEAVKAEQARVAAEALEEARRKAEEEEKHRNAEALRAQEARLAAEKHAAEKEEERKALEAAKAEEEQRKAEAMKAEEARLATEALAEAKRREEVEKQGAHARFGGAQTVEIPVRTPSPQDQPSTIMYAETAGLALSRAESIPNLGHGEADSCDLQDRTEHIEERSRKAALEMPRTPSPVSPTSNKDLLAPQPSLMLAETTTFNPLATDTGNPTQPLLGLAETTSFGPAAVDADDFIRKIQLQKSMPAGEDGLGKFRVPDTSDMTMEEKRKAMDELLNNVLETRIAFEPNKAEIHQHGYKTVRELANVLAAFPAFAVKCVGHSKGKPSENNDAKRRLSQERAEAVKEALVADGVQNEIICASFGSALGRGMCVRLNALSTEEVEEGELSIPDCSDLSKDQQEASLNQLLHEVLEKGLAFEPNKASIQDSCTPVIRRVTRILKGFPDFAIRCEGHAKGTAADDNEAKHQLSQVRAEALRAAVAALGATNTILCVGMGSSQSLGMCVRMFATDPDKEVQIPDVIGMSEEDQGKILDSLLFKVLERGIEFEPNKSEIPPSASSTVRSLSRVLMAFPSFVLCCEGHTKGQPADNTEAKQKLSHSRAECLKAAVLAAGASNKILCKGAGSSQGRGLCVRMFVIDPEELKKDEIIVPDTAGMSKEEKAALLDQLLEKALQKNIDFEPNVYEVPASGADTIRNIAKILERFPDFAIRCEGHAKGQPADNTEAKKKLSYMRAEAVKAAIKQQGVKTGILCVGEGCSQGLGMRVRMVAIDPEELRKDDVVIPEVSGLSREVRIKTLNELLSKALEKNISFEPNKADIQAAGLDVVEQLAKVLIAFHASDMPRIKCEGHAKGKPSDNNEAKIRLSQVRAEAVSNALKNLGVENEIVCVGIGSGQGLGMGVRMFTEVPPT